MLISFEGGDRCGKTTQIELLKKEIEQGNQKVVTLKHPNRLTASGKIIDKYLKKELELGNEAITLCLTSNLWETS
jgi:dTMP kinase